MHSSSSASRNSLATARICPVVLSEIRTDDFTDIERDWLKTEGLKIQRDYGTVDQSRLAEAYRRAVKENKFGDTNKGLRTGDFLKRVWKNWTKGAEYKTRR
jgi:hypothetical protein